MGNFRKVSDTTNVPNFIEKKFVASQVEIEDDPYADLRRNSAENKIKISKQSIGLKKEASVKPWEVIQGAANYNDSAQFTFEDQISSGNYNRKEERVASDLQAYSSEDYMNAFMNQSLNVFDPAMMDISSEFMNSQDSTSQQSIIDTAHKREARASKHSQWESNAMECLRKSQVVNSRAHSILRVASDVESRQSQFGVLDPNELDQREQMRAANQNKAREQRLAIKKRQQEDLISKSLNGSKTLADIYNSFDLD